MCTLHCTVSDFLIEEDFMWPCMARSLWHMLPGLCSMLSALEVMLLAALRLND